MSRYVIGFLLAVGLIVLVIVLIVRSLTSGPGEGKQLDLNSYSNTDVAVRLTLDTPVAASETHRDVIITVDNTEATLAITRGYEGQVVNSTSYPMNTSAYAVFLRSLTVSGYTRGINDPAVRDERGHCPLGNRYIYEVVDGDGKVLQHYWYTSCNEGTFKGKSSQVRSLFERQIPDYTRLIRGVPL